MTSPFTAPATPTPTGVQTIEAPPEAPPEAEVVLETSFGTVEPEVETVDPVAVVVAVARTPKGFLEAKIKEVTDAFELGEIEVPSGFLTSHQIALAIQKNYPDEKRPSQGAVAACLGRWTKVGFIEVAEKPYRFVTYTDAAADIGLRGLKKIRAETRKAERKALKEATKAAKAAEATTE